MWPGVTNNCVTLLYVLAWKIGMFVKTHVIARCVLVTEVATQDPGGIYNMLELCHIIRDWPLANKNNWMQNSVYCRVEICTHSWFYMAPLGGGAGLILLNLAPWLVAQNCLPWQFWYVKLQNFLLAAGWSAFPVNNFLQNITHSYLQSHDLLLILY